MNTMKLIKCKGLIDGTGAAPVANGAILIKNDRIEMVGEYNEVLKSAPKDVLVLDYSENFITPGIIDTHVHVVIDPDADFTGFVGRDSDTVVAHRGMVNLKKTLDGGVTFIRDLGGYHFIDIELKKLVDAGKIEGPDLVASGKMITMTGGHGWSIGRECDGEDEVRKATREQLKAGATIIKIMATGGNLTPGPQGAPQLSEEEIRAAVEEAHKNGKRTTTHSHSAQGVKNALYAGIDCIEHGMFIDEECIDYMIEHGIYYVPTLVAPWICATVGEEKGLSKEAVIKTQGAVQRHMNNFRLAVSKGVKIAMGTDAGTPFCEHGKAYVDEFKLMVEGGFTPMQAIVAATQTAAMVVGIEKDHGTLEVGKKANLLVLNANPIEDLDTFRNLREVYKNGDRVERKYL